jgi:hypothetical protein
MIDGSKTNAREFTVRAWVIAGVCLGFCLAGAPTDAAAADVKKAQPAPSTTPEATDTGCKTPLEQCTRDRIAALKAQSKSLTAAARLKPSATLSAEEKARVQDYDRWLRKQSEKTRELAERGGAATTRPMQESFNQQYLTLQAQMQRENRQYSAISNIMKTKHDTVKNSISNVR